MWNFADFLQQKYFLTRIRHYHVQFAERIDWYKLSIGPGWLHWTLLLEGLFMMPYLSKFEFYTLVSRCCKRLVVTVRAALVQIIAWYRPGDKPLSKPMMVRLPTHICKIADTEVSVQPSVFHLITRMAERPPATLYVWYTSNCTANSTEGLVDVSPFKTI